MCLFFFFFEKIMKHNNNCTYYPTKPIPEKLLGSVSCECVCGVIEVELPDLPGKERNAT